MANALKLIIPLLDESLDSKDLSKESGFKDAYLEDINRPSLTNHIFLLYDGKLDTETKIKRDEKLRNCENLYMRKTIFIKGSAYLLYIFVILSNSIIRVRDGRLPYNEKDLGRIIFFWNLQDSFINEVMLDKKVSFTINDLIVPEEDYIQSWEDEFEFVP